MVMKPLPLEVKGAIFSLLDTESLKQCSLVDQESREIAQRLLFSNRNVKIRRTMCIPDENTRFLENKENIFSLYNRSPHLAEYLQSLTIHVDRKTDFVLELPPPADNSEISKFAALEGKFKNLHRISFVGELSIPSGAYSEWEELVNDLQNTILTPDIAKNLRSLDVGCMPYSLIHSKLFPSLSRLDDLTLQFGTTRHHDTSMTGEAALIQPIQVRKATIYCRYTCSYGFERPRSDLNFSSHWPAFIHKRIHLASLRTLDLSAYNMITVQPQWNVQGLLDVCGKVVEHLEIRVPLNEEHRPYNLSKFDNLCRLNIHGCPKRENAVPWILEVMGSLPQLQSNSLSASRAFPTHPITVFFEFGWNYELEERPLDLLASCSEMWKALDTMPMCRIIQNVTVNVHPLATYPSVLHATHIDPDIPYGILSEDEVLKGLMDNGKVKLFSFPEIWMPRFVM
ncbi:hypothetical protein CVT24_004471 [Panaeolus cyanescens]|uniref:F-box domain-containing protein n=1 Tax=Panaeolus cyanescens TaxID=181874 RepID=A0A409V9Z0_9AGAR|nr:hypothetical protein CVT24_004471 [Panaeolus cyanescens]